MLCFYLIRKNTQKPDTDSAWDGKKFCLMFYFLEVFSHINIRQAICHCSGVKSFLVIHVVKGFHFIFKTFSIVILEIDSECSIRDISVFTFNPA